MCPWSVYQPDHWTINQFPKGRAREPILGVRPTDADYFCNWLTKRENTGWNYRVPRSIEEQSHKHVKTSQAQNGYWTYPINRKAQFAWVAATPPDARHLTLDPTLVHDLNEGINLVKSAPLNLDRVWNYGYANAKDVDLGLYIKLALDRNQFRVQKEASRIAHDLYFRRDPVSQARLWPDGYSSHIRNFIANPDPVLNHARDRALSLASSVVAFSVKGWDLNNLDLARTSARSAALEKAFNIDPAEESEIDSSVEIFFYLFLFMEICTLQERIAGRSPAFEGIRLVKERK